MWVEVSLVCPYWESNLKLKTKERVEVYKSQIGSCFSVFELFQNKRVVLKLASTPLASNNLKFSDDFR